MSATSPDDPLARPLALGGGLSTAKKLMLLIAMPFLVLFTPLLALVLPTILVALAGWAAVFRPAMLHGLPRDVRFVVRLVKATRQLKQRLSRSAGTFTTADYWAETVAAHGPREAHRQFAL